MKGEKLSYNALFKTDSPVLSQGWRLDKLWSVVGAQSSVYLGYVGQQNQFNLFLSH
jgi:hypothetical protein